MPIPSVLAAADQTPLIIQDLPLILAGILLPVILSGAMVFARRSFASQPVKDFLGISAMFVVLAGFTFLMIVGEHVLG
ncbi:MAG TPA: hypothetical protein VGR61_01960 [Candidatus Dormibacteraeota bacterium]|nr:hypothetical protein [Candidatus Dormibacteraeota bacterium]